MYGLIGYPLGHSFSAKYFAEKFKRENIDEKYELFPIQKIEDIELLLKKNKSLKGFNVTIPYKRSIFGYLDEVSEDAKDIGAVNVVRIERDECAEISGLVGYNTDWSGFYESLLPLLNNNIKQALILGTGGASAAVAYALSRLGIKYTFVSRIKKNQYDSITYPDIDEQIIKDNLLIINTTPLGMYPEISTCPDIPYNLLTEHHICYDLVYNPEVTEFMKRSSKFGARVKNGLEMLHIQAELSWRIWNEH